MAKKKMSYWELRNILDEEKMHRSLDSKEAVIINAYLKGQKYLSNEVQKIYKRYLNKTGLSENEVKKILNTSIAPDALVELQSLVKTVKSPDIKKQVQNYLTGLAVKHRITRLEELKAKSYIVSKQIADVQLRTSTDFYIDVIQDSYKTASVESIIGQTEKSFSLYDDGKYKSIDIIDGKLQLDILDDSNKVVKSIDLIKDSPVKEFKELSTKYVNNILESDWKGSNYSKRIWNDTDLLAKRLEEMFAVKEMTGMSERDMSKELAKEFGTSISVAKRLVRTEANYVAGQAKLKGWKEHGVTHYILLAVLDLRTSIICKEKDSQIHEVAKAICNGKFGNYPPFHPWCRTIAVAYFGKNSLNGKRIANDPISNKTFSISQSDGYKKWEELLLAKHGQANFDLQKKKVKQYKVDLIQFNKYRKILGKDLLPKTLDDFQNLKYTDKEKWNEILKLLKQQK